MLHGVQRPKSPNTRSNASQLTECVQPECGMGSSLNSPSHSECGLCGRLIWIGRVKRVYPVPLDPGNSPALDLRVVKWRVATPSHVRSSRVLGKVDTLKPRLRRRTHACPDETKFGCAQLGDSTGEI
ncbi:hypothetical protein CRG98_023456 [Punica granatum]|uniref:Uncharacterized protein n=1 Tax=Punica granatum TaxID=22663 RepID=A0A2I0JIP4_PUNGR|nr:hypothetical protein CRG98_023456 [Punica granatum]